MPKTKINNIDLKIEMQIDLAKIVMAVVVLILILGGYMKAGDIIKIEQDKATAQIELTRAQAQENKCDCPEPNCPAIEGWAWSWNTTYPIYWTYVNKGG